MTDWKTLDEILPEMGRAAEADPENWRERFEALNFFGSSELSSLTYLSPDDRYRRKPLTYTIERPKPTLKRPKFGEKYWTPNLASSSWTTKHQWVLDDTDIRLFNRGLCYATEEEAVAAAKAMVGGE